MKTRMFSCVEFLFAASLVLGLFHSCPTVSGEVAEEKDAQQIKEKLLIIMLDGFRWDYYDNHKSSLPSFQHFLSEGVQTEWVEPIFPPVSYPAWTTISTGVFPETHGIIGNYMFDLNRTDPTQAVFDLLDPNTTMKLQWWQNSEPIWTTATRYEKKASLRFWSRCDVPVHEVRPHECIGYRPASGVESLRNSLNIAVQRLKQDYDLVMVYGEHLDNVGHKHGPESPELKQALIAVDNVLNELQDSLIDSQLEEIVNIIILSDHGMTFTGDGSGVKYINLDNYLETSEIIRSLDRGAVVSIAPYAKNYMTVYNRLKAINGTNVYKREDIPEEYHYKNGRLVQDILLVAKEKHFIRGLQSTKQIPRDRETNGYWNGLHGYPKMNDMRAIFFAKGPAFKKGIIHPPINMEDEYQIFARILNIPAQPHNGSWSRVSDMLVNGAVPSRPLLPIICTFALSFVTSRILIPSST